MDLIQLKLCDIQGRLPVILIQSTTGCSGREKNIFWRNLQTSALRRKRAMPGMMEK